MFQNPKDRLAYAVHLDHIMEGCQKICMLHDASICISLTALLAERVARAASAKNACSLHLVAEGIACPMTWMQQTRVALPLLLDVIVDMLKGSLWVVGFKEGSVVGIRL